LAYVVNLSAGADSLQDALGFFERVARLRAVVPRDRFLKWLRMPNAQLDGKSPLDLMANDERQVVVDLVEDMLTGHPLDAHLASLKAALRTAPAFDDGGSGCDVHGCHS